VDPADKDRIEQQIQDEARRRFPGAAVRRVVVLQHGDNPRIEPGALLIRIQLAAGPEREDREHAVDAFQTTQQAAFEQFRKDLAGRVPPATHVEITAEDDQDEGPKRVLRASIPEPAGRPLGSDSLTPVMARLGPTDLETLDLLITAGIASSRAEGVRWALARIRERPAYTRLLERTKEIEELKSQF
jgi:hypothetical protein